MVRLFAHTFLVSLLFLTWVQGSRAQTVPDTSATPASYSLTISLPKVVMSGLETPVSLAVEPAAAALTLPNRIQVNGQEQPVSWQGGKAKLAHRFPTGAAPLTIVAGAARAEQTVHPIPAWLSVIPPLLAILMALVFREVLSALFLGIFVGAAIIGYYQEGWLGIFTGLFAVIDTYVLDSLTDSGHQSIVVFSMVIGAVVAVVSRNGGMQGVVNRIAAMANTARSGQLATWILGISIFFDDYANTLVVGNTMRAVTDKLRISREKLSYLVDSTAAPVAAIAFVTTWIGAELGYIEDGIANIPEMQGSVYSIFVQSLAYSFYPIFTLAFMLMLVLKNRDFGPMYRAEHRARTTGLVQNKPLDSSGGHNAELESFQAAPGIRSRSLNAVLPIAVIIFGTLVGLLHTGFSSTADSLREAGVALANGSWGTIWAQLPQLPQAPESFLQKLGSIIGASDSYVALLWSSISGLLVAILLSVGQRVLSLGEAIEATMNGFRTMLTAVLILVLAWSLAEVAEDLSTDHFLAEVLSSRLTPVWVPVLTFLLSAATAFATGSSWGTMALLYPLVLPTCWSICQEAGYDLGDSQMIFYNVVSGVLAGSVLGDHCSPISDTTILSSLASSCNHIDHVRTQLPYALTVGSVAMLVGTLPAAMGAPPLLLFVIGLVALYLIVHFFGKRVPAANAAASEGAE